VRSTCDIPRLFWAIFGQSRTLTVRWYYRPGEQLPKLTVGVRFPSPAPPQNRWSAAVFHFPGDHDDVLYEPFLAAVGRHLAHVEDGDGSTWSWMASKA